MQLVWLSGAWLSYFVIHSALATPRWKNRIRKAWPRMASCYRLAYNLLAALLLLPIIALLNAYQGPSLWAWHGFGLWLCNGAAMLAVMGFFWSLRYYDMGEFLGLHACRSGQEEGAYFRLSPLHRFVRHPWYSFALVIIWTRDMDPGFLLSSLFMTLYFIVGSRLEERKLITAVGAAYRDYCQRVPALLPRPWRYLTERQREDLEQLAALAHQERTGGQAIRSAAGKRREREPH